MIKSSIIRVFIGAVMLASVLLVTWIVVLSKERVKNTKYDKELGWSNIHGFYNKNGFGKDIYIKINSQGFRNNRDFDLSIPAGKVRVVCSGDSYTFGHGVSNDDAWCEQLTGIDDRLETINMGQKGYGIDQSYLWFLRDGMKFDYNIQVFGIIYDDFNRFGKRFLLYNKPALQLENDELRVINVPVPRKTYITRLLNNFLPYKENDRPTETVDRDTSRQIAMKIFENLETINQNKGSRLVVVYLPAFYGDLLNDTNADLRSFLSRELKERNIDFLNLSQDFERLSKDELKTIFINNDGKGWHYSPSGNRFVAGLIYKHLTSILSSE